MKKVKTIMAAVLAMASISTMAAESNSKNMASESTLSDMNPIAGQEMVFKTIRPKKPDFGSNV